MQLPRVPSSARALGVFGVIATIVAACGGSAAPTASAIPTLNLGNPFASISIGLPVASGTVTGHVGDKLTFSDYGDDPIDVTLVKVFDPAVSTDTSAESPPGAHWFGAEVVIDTHSAIGADAEVIDATASDGTTLTTDDDYKGTAYPLENFQGCTEVINDEPSGTYCVAFVVPNGQTITKIGAKVGGAEIYETLVPTDQASWAIP
jgi:hypothetical protein